MSGRAKVPARGAGPRTASSPRPRLDALIRRQPTTRGPPRGLVGEQVGNGLGRTGNADHFLNRHPGFLAVFGSHDDQLLVVDQPVHGSAATPVDGANHTGAGLDAFAGAVQAWSAQRRPFGGGCGGATPARETLAWHSVWSFRCQRTRFAARPTRAGQDTWSQELGGTSSPFRTACVGFAGGPTTGPTPPRRAHGFAVLAHVAAGGVGQRRVPREKAPLGRLAGDGVAGTGYAPASGRFGSYTVPQLPQRTWSSSIQTSQSMSS